MNKVGIAKDKRFLDHFSPYPHPENPERLMTIYRMIDSGPLKEKLHIIAERKASKDEIALNHSDLHIRRIEETAEHEFSSLDGDTFASRSSFEAALLASGSCIGLTEEVVKGELSSAFALVRPPGHHAEPDRAMGFCLFNNIAIAAKYALTKLALKRIAIVDFVLHHGNGTQNSFYETDSVLFISTHQYPHYPGSGALEETGKGAGEGFNVNIPLSSGCGDNEYALVYSNIVSPILSAYKPELILVSAGFDIYKDDPLGGMQVSSAGFGAISSILMEAAQRTCAGKIVYVLEGGYSPAGLEEGTAKIFEALLNGKPSSESLSTKGPSDRFKPFLDAYLNSARRFWKI